MTLEQIQKRVNDINECASDYEAAHELEDCLYEDFIRLVSQSKSKKLAEMAKVVLSTKDSDFPRYCA
jgi:UDP-N-acetyl-D-mannosaminuronate dehydrogenase